MQNAEPVLEASRPNRAACALDLEGIVAKRFDDVYEPLIDGHNPGMRPCEIADVEPRDVAGFRRVFRWWRRPPQNLPAIISRTQSAPARRPRSRPARSIVYNCALIDFARHHAFQPKACRPYRAKTKGKVERPYRYIREDFFLARSFRNLDDLLGRCLPPDSCCRSGTRFLNYSPLRILP